MIQMKRMNQNEDEWKVRINMKGDDDDAETDDDEFGGYLQFFISFYFHIY